uniref:Uncharacterized protein n=1 Tax=Cuerna arida TaxID=1464854 RepID=A0A1B6F139_9HEMI
MFTVKTQIVPVAVLILCIGTLASVEPSGDRPLNTTVPKFNITTLPAPLTEDDIKNISLISQAQNSSQLFGETDAEHFGDLSVIDVLFRKRRKEGCDEVQEKADYSEDYPRAEESPVSVEEVELVSYEEIGSSEAGREQEEEVQGREEEEWVEQRSNLSTITDYLTPPSEGANCTSFAKEQSENNTTEETVTTVSA